MFIFIVFWLGIHDWPPGQFFWRPLYFFPYTLLSFRPLLLFLYHISLLLFPCASVWKYIYLYSILWKMSGKEFLNTTSGKVLAVQKVDVKFTRQRTGNIINLNYIFYVQDDQIFCVRLSLSWVLQCTPWIPPSAAVHAVHSSECRGARHAQAGFPAGVQGNLRFSLFAIGAHRSLLWRQPLHGDPMLQ